MQPRIYRKEYIGGISTNNNPHEGGVRTGSGRGLERGSGLFSGQCDLTPIGRPVSSESRINFQATIVKLGNNSEYTNNWWHQKTLRAQTSKKFPTKEFIS